MNIKKNFRLQKVTTMRLGGSAQYFIVVKKEKELLKAKAIATAEHKPWYIMGEGSNLVVKDSGYKGIVIANKISYVKIKKNRVIAGAGTNLLELISKLNSHNLSGLERMAGIPGTVGGAVYGSAGAYGQEIKNTVKKVKILDGKKFRYIINKECEFGYRESVFKRKKHWIIVEVEMVLKPGSRRKQEKISRDIIELRKIKYKPGLLCPGSFFKNILLSDLAPEARQQFLKNIPKEQAKYQKVPTGFLLDEVGAKGLFQGGIHVANHHGNLIYNTKSGTTKDLKILAKRLKALVKNKFGITIEEEVQYL